VAGAGVGRPVVLMVFCGVDIGAESRSYDSDVSKRVAKLAGGVRPT